MATLPTNFSVTKVRSCPIPNPDTNTPKPDLINSEDSSSVDKPDLFTSLESQGIENPVVIGSESQPNVDTPNLITSESQSNVDTPDLITSESQSNVDAPDLITSQSAQSVGTPDLIGSQSQPSIDTPDTITSQGESSIPIPSAITAVSGTDTTPPFPENHARIQYDNLLFNYSSITTTNGTNPEYSVIPNSYQRWTFDNSTEIEISLSSAISVDTVCIGAHNLSGNDFTVDVSFDSSGGGTFTPFGSTVTPTTNNAIMIHLSGSVPVSVLKIEINGTGTNKYVGYISAGIALQMQRPFFNGYTPMTDERFTEFYTSWTETRNIIGREVRRRGIENSPSWTNLDDTWYRTYLEPAKDTLEVFPFFMAWNLLEYPDDVGMMILTNFFSAPMQNGRMIRRNVSMQMTGVL